MTTAIADITMSTSQHEPVEVEPIRQMKRQGHPANPIGASIGPLASTYAIESAIPSLENAREQDGERASRMQEL